MKMILKCSCIQTCLPLRFWRKTHDFLGYLTPLRFGKFAVFPESFRLTTQDPYIMEARSNDIDTQTTQRPMPGMSLEAGNRRKSPVTLAGTAGYFFSLKKIMRENVSSISNTTYRRVSTDQKLVYRLAYPYDFGVRLTIFWAILRPYDSANLRYFRKVFGSDPSFHCGSVYYRLYRHFRLLKKMMSIRQNFDNKPKIDLKC
jgi:hypothetical protein